MNDLINRQDAITSYQSVCRCVSCAECTFLIKEGAFTDCRLERFIHELPSAQPEITHCAECIHWKHSAVRKSYCEVFDWMSTAEDFCSFAERKTNEE